jgi:6-phosphogluconate dehydrogenase
MESGDIIINGGNSNYREDYDRAAALAEHGIEYMDVGTSGGVWGLERGYLPHDRRHRRRRSATASRSSPRSLPAWGPVDRTPGRLRRARPGGAGLPALRPAGAGHFVKMVHNGIEYGIMAAYAEGLNVLAKANSGATRRPTRPRSRAARAARSTTSTTSTSPKVTEVWRRGSVISSWLLDLTAAR